MAYQYITLGSLRGELLARLQDAGAVATTTAEANLYIAEGLRLINALTYAWNIPYRFDFNAGDTWKSLNVAGSPRQRTVTDSYLYSQIEAMLYEPMSGGTWTGTSQYNIGILSASLQYRRDELLMQSAANVQNLIQNSPVMSVTSVLPDVTLDLLRVRWIPQDKSMPYALSREDVNTVNAFGALLNIQPGPPCSWMITANTPLSFDVSCPPNQPGNFDMLVSNAGATFVPPTPTVVGIPDDWTPALIYGCLADVLANSPEGRDAARAKYCLDRYEQLKKAMLRLPWLLEATVADIPVDTPSFSEMDAWMQDWEQRQPIGDPNIVVGGVDYVALAPFVPAASGSSFGSVSTGSSGGSSVSSVLVVVGNAPIPSSDTSYVQLSRDGVDALLNYCQHVASFKLGGADFAATMPLYEQFEAYCRRKNAEYAAMGIFRPQMVLEGNRGDQFSPRFDPEVPLGKTTG